MLRATCTDSTGCLSLALCELTMDYLVINDRLFPKAGSKPVWEKDSDWKEGIQARLTKQIHAFLEPRLQNF